MDNNSHGPQYQILLSLQLRTEREKYLNNSRSFISPIFGTSQCLVEFLLSIFRKNILYSYLVGCYLISDLFGKEELIFGEV